MAQSEGQQPEAHRETLSVFRSFAYQGRSVQSRQPPLAGHRPAVLCNHMVTERPVFAAIADPTRRAILDAIRGRERVRRRDRGLFPVSRPAISKHLRVLRGAGLVRERRVAQSRLYSLDPAPLRDVERWLDHYKVFWAARLHDLKRVVEQEERRPPPRRNPMSWTHEHSPERCSARGDGRPVRADGSGAIDSLDTLLAAIHPREAGMAKKEKKGKQRKEREEEAEAREDGGTAGHGAGSESRRLQRRPPAG